MRRRPATPDARRLAEAVKQPGIDPRTWVSVGRIDNDPDAMRYDPELGWVVDVAPYGSDIEGDSEIPCRVISPGAGDQQGEFLPPTRGAEVVLVFPGGDPEASPLCVGYCSNGDACRAPSAVNDLPIDPDTTSSTDATVSPLDTEIKVSPHHRREHYALDHHDQARNQVLEAAEQVKLASRDAAQSFVRGERFVQVLNTWIDAVSSYVQANGAADAKIYAAVNTLAPGSVTPQEIADVAAAVLEVPLQKTAFQAAAVEGDALSAKVKGP
jgi:hypothetical protein